MRTVEQVVAAIQKSLNAQKFSEALGIMQQYEKLLQARELEEHGLYAVNFLTKSQLRELSKHCIVKFDISKAYLEGLTVQQIEYLLGAGILQDDFDAVALFIDVYPQLLKKWIERKGHQERLLVACAHTANPIF